MHGIIVYKNMVLGGLGNGESKLFIEVASL